jgi:hypothetical protein
MEDTFTIINDTFNRTVESTITFNVVHKMTDRNDRDLYIYKRTPDEVQQFGHMSLTTAHKWAVKYGYKKDRNGNRFFKTLKAAKAFAAELEAELKVA